jgi:hypothetical protein
MMTTVTTIANSRPERPRIVIASSDDIAATVAPGYAFEARRADGGTPLGSDPLPRRLPPAPVPFEAVIGRWSLPGGDQRLGTVRNRHPGVRRRTVPARPAW